MTDNDAPTKGTTWYDRDYPVLRATARLVQGSSYSQATTSQIAAASGFDVSDVVKALNNLKEQYVRVTDVSSIAARDYLVIGLTPDGLVATDVWPSADTVVERLIAALKSAVEEAPEDSAKQSRLRSAWQALVDLSTGATANVLAQAVTSAMGLTG